MKTLMCALAVGLFSATAAAAQPAAPAPEATAPANAHYDLDTPIEVLVADPGARAVLDKNLPNLRSHPAYEQFKSMSLRQLQPYSEGKITDEILAQTEKDLKALSPANAK
jgi:hypothetical protein